MTFYETFELALQKTGMSTADVCNKTGLYPAYFSKLKSKHAKDVTWERALMIIAALGMTPNEFYELSQGSDEQ